MNNYKKNFKFFRAFFLFLLLACSNVSAQSNKYFSNWEKGTSPQEIGRKISENWLARIFDIGINRRQSDGFAVDRSRTV